MCKTLSGNDCPLLTITSFYNENSVYQNERQTIPLRKNKSNRKKEKCFIDTISLDERSYVILTSRVHPGESNASWVMKGIIDYLLSDEPTARLLRDRFIFKVKSLNTNSIARLDDFIYRLFKDHSDVKS